MIFYDLNTRIVLKPGDVIFFKSKWLLHGNAPLSLPAIHTRYSLTFFTKQRDFHYEEVENSDFGDEEEVNESDEGNEPILLICLISSR